MALATLIALSALSPAPDDLACRAANGRVYVRVRAGDATGWWLVDTGATHTVASPRTAHSWPHAADTPREAENYGLTAWAVPPPMTLGHNRIRLSRVAILPRLAERFLAEDDIFVAGILGWDLLGQQRWRLDPARGHARVMASAGWPPPRLAGHWPLEERHGSPVLNLRHAGGQTWSMLLDTGTGALLLSVPAARRSGWQSSHPGEAGARIEGLASTQASWLWPTRLASRGPLAPAQTILVTDRAPMAWVDGVLGTDFLAGRALWWDGPGGWWGVSAPPRPARGRSPA
ncbi:MAG: hypothetical protein FJY99_13525 [Candidatus Sericytochromatia bacterium]|nr:hypothetical protein [Candidatus Tanganyikabacteria bacterium]